MSPCMMPPAIEGREGYGGLECKEGMYGGGVGARKWGVICADAGAPDSLAQRKWSTSHDAA